MTIPLFLRSLNALNTILTKAEAYAKDSNTPESKLLSTRLRPDMEHLAYQIQRVSDTAKNTCVRIAGIAECPMADTESTFEELHGRIRKTIDVLESVREEDFVGQEGKQVVMKRSAGNWETNGKEYVMVFAVPNFYFHVVTAYAILRHSGVPIGKMDYLGVA
ncbi:MAG: hypothetical protein Q9217_003030 [Psora testacea]